MAHEMIYDLACSPCNKNVSNTWEEREKFLPTPLGASPSLGTIMNSVTRLGKISQLLAIFEGLFSRYLAKLWGYFRIF